MTDVFEISQGRDPLKADLEDTDTQESEQGEATAGSFIDGWFFINGEGWQFTSPQVYPRIYSEDDDGWLWFKSGNSNEQDGSSPFR